MASLYRRGAQFWISYMVSGERVQRALNTTNERVARDKQRQIEYELSIGDLHVVSKLPLALILEDFCGHQQAKRPYKAYRNDFSKLRVFFGPRCEALKLGTLGGNSRKPYHDRYADAHVKAELLEDITPELINRFIATRIRENHWSAKTANALREILHRLFAFAIKHHGFRSRDRRYPNPAAAVERQRESAPEIRFLTLAQVDEQLEILQDHATLRVLVATYIYAGLRREEALWLTHEDVDLERRVIRVRAKTIAGEYWQPKTKRNRAVPISEALLAILRTYQATPGCTWYFPSPTGKRWDPDNLYQDLRSLNQAHGLDWSCLDYRHTFGSHLAQKGESLYKIATLMGNSPDICRRHYAALIPEAMLDTVEFLPREAAAGGNGDGKAEQMLAQILEKLQDQPEKTAGRPRLRLVHDD
jgi:integrase